MKKEYADLEISQFRELKQLHEESRPPKQVVANLTLDKTILRDAIGKKQ